VTGNHLDDDSSWSKSSAVVVAVRVRPYQGRELRDPNSRMIIEMNGNTTTIYDPATVDEADPAKRKKKTFTFDHSYYSFCERKDTESKGSDKEKDEIHARRYKLPGKGTFSSSSCGSSDGGFPSVVVMCERLASRGTFHDDNDNDDEDDNGDDDGDML
jgi:hypothetical protein